MTHFRAVMIVRVELVRLDVSVDERLRMVGVDLVEVLLRNGRGEDKPWRQGDSNERTAQPG